MSIEHFTSFTDLYRVTRDGAILRLYPEPDAEPLATLARGQLLRRLDTVNWAGAWYYVFADVAGGPKAHGYLHFEEVEDIDDDTPATQAPQQQPPAPQPAPPQQQPAPQQPQQQAPPQPAPQPAPAQPPQSAPATGAKPIMLGCVDNGVTEAQCTAYMQAVARQTGLRPDRAAAGHDMINIDRMPAPPSGVMTVAQVQQALNKIGFFPGGETDGICGYRTRSAIRLFQEYVRVYEGPENLIPDGVFGPVTQTHLLRWAQSDARPDWRPREGEYGAWLQQLGAAKAKYVADPGPVLTQVNAFPTPTATRKTQDWVVGGDGAIHLIGVRREEFRKQDGTTQFDDIFVLLIKGLVFKFQGTTDPGASGSAQGAAVLTHGQHHYRFGWHGGGSQLALEPKDPGALIHRSSGDFKLDPADIARGVSVNGEINIHWGGPGAEFDVSTWSKGCQTIGGTFYIDPADRLWKLPYAALGTRRLSATKTRGAYNVLADLVISQSGDMPNPGVVNYTLLNESDLSPQLKGILDNAKQRVLAAL